MYIWQYILQLCRWAAFGVLLGCTGLLWNIRPAQAQERVQERTQERTASSNRSKDSRYTPETLEIRPLDLSQWSAKDSLEGRAYNADHAFQNRLKNRPWRDVRTIPADSILHWSFDDFVRITNTYSAEVGIVPSESARNRAEQARERKPLSDTAKKIIERYSRQIVALTGWMNLVYPAGAEATNCYSPHFHDWHIELSASPRIQPPRAGDSTAIVCEITPRTERALYQAGVRLRQLSSVMRLGEPPFIQYFPTGSKPHKVRIIGVLLMDNSHNQPGEDIGAVIERQLPGGYHHPWRATAWEVHPIYSIEDLGTQE